MVSALLQKYLLGTLSAQVALSLINTLFILGDTGVALALIGFWGLLQSSTAIMLFFACAEGLSIAVDIIRLVLWGPYITGNLLQIPATLGMFYLVLTIFGVIVKCVDACLCVSWLFTSLCCRLITTIFTLMVRRELQLWARDPHRASTVKRGELNWIIPDLRIGLPVSQQERSPDPALLPQPPAMAPATEETRLLMEEVPAALATKPAPKHSRHGSEAFVYESFGPARSIQ